MGKVVAELLDSEFSRHELALVVSEENAHSDWQSRLINVDVAIEFSTPASVIQNIKTCFQQNVPVVVGTTGWNKHLNAVKSIAENEGKSIFFAPNFSIGVNLFFQLNGYLADLMNPHSQYDVKVEESHHVTKLDKPSGTAVRLLEDITLNLNRKGEWQIGETPEKTSISVKVNRKKDVKGIHEITFFSEEDRITISHEAFSRKGFARGAVMAAQWLIGKQGFFEMKDMLAST